MAKFDDFRMHVRIVERFSKRHDDAQLPETPPHNSLSDQQHEDAHAAIDIRYFQYIEGAAKTIFDKCVCLACYRAEDAWDKAVVRYAVAWRDTENDIIDFSDHDPGFTQSSIDQDRRRESEAQRAVKSAYDNMVQACN
jgi:hypothetical protein